jgi:hypothetical protein
MAVGVRFFVAGPDDMFERWSLEQFNSVWDVWEPVAEFAGRRLRHALVFDGTQTRIAVGGQAFFEFVVRDPGHPFRLLLI